MPATTERDYFTDLTVLKDPYDYFEEFRAKGPIAQSEQHNMLVVTGFDEALEILKNTRDFSSINAPQGAGVPLPFEPEPGKINEQIEAHRDQILGGSLIVTYDGDNHTRTRTMLNRLFSPKRLKENEAFIENYSQQLVSESIAKGRCELINDIATPFVTLVIADLLGVPPDDRELFREAIDNAPPPGNMQANEDHDPSQDPLVVMGGYFYNYVVDRRENPRDDVLTILASTTYPDGELPDVIEIVSLATFLFGAGQDTSAKLLGNAMRFLVEDKVLQQSLREDPSLIPNFIEEVLRLEGSTKMTTRLAVNDAEVCGTKIKAGTPVMIALAAANRDPRRWENPLKFDLHRPRLREHLAFGRGPHVCAGSPLARVEISVILEHFLTQTSDISLDEAIHGPDHNLEYEPSFIIRGLANLNLKLTAA